MSSIETVCEVSKSLFLQPDLSSAHVERRKELNARRRGLVQAYLKQGDHRLENLTRLIGRRAREESEKAVLYLSFGRGSILADNNFGLSQMAGLDDCVPAVFRF
jgi:hypothetical protein